MHMGDPLRSVDRPGLGRATIGYRPADNDLLSEVLRDLRLAHARYGRSELTAPWGIAVPFREGVRFHAMLEGQCWIRAKSLPPLLLECGDVLLLPHGTEHTMSDRPKRRALPLEDVKPALIGNGTYELRSGGGGPRSLIACCTIGFEGPTANPLLELLPPVMHIRYAEHSDTDLPNLLAMMAREADGQRIGSATVMARLADIVMTQVIRSWVETCSDDLTGWLAAVRDPQIGSALARIHRSPGKTGQSIAWPHCLGCRDRGFRSDSRVYCRYLPPAISCNGGLGWRNPGCGTDICRCHRSRRSWDMSPMHPSAGHSNAS